MKMKIENIRKIAEERKVADIETFVKFISQRFPDESDRITSYVSEWAERFNTGKPEKYMDEESTSIYTEILEKKIKVMKHEN